MFLGQKSQRIISSLGVKSSTPYLSLGVKSYSPQLDVDSLVKNHTPDGIIRNESNSNNDTGKSKISEHSFASKY